ncbi:MAG: hypothetical protein Ct9H300mP25_04560 [Acidobacteriota bacterium]|nr:MAG: hypothetical protein Ct9H300mP25_04560 [Acidobacteriota bacterium]
MVCALCLVCFLIAERTIFAKTKQPETHDPLVTTLGTRALDVEYQLWYYVKLFLNQKSRPTADGYEYRYRLTNKGEPRSRPVASTEESPFADTVDTSKNFEWGYSNQVLSQTGLS